VCCSESERRIYPQITQITQISFSEWSSAFPSFDGRGGFSSAAPVAVGRGVWRLVMDDLNANLKIDVVTSNLESNSVSVLLGK